tara:strand:- start:1729 stop:2772 length:1044 start_codon:yes stop_codon:yes gene_type:complete
MANVLKSMIKQFMPFAQQQMGFDRVPRLFLKNDDTEASNPMGKTGFYDPNEESITIYIGKRHPKDIMRSLSHELMHHTQKCNGDFEGVNNMGEQGYAQNDSHLRNMEIQAYQASIVFRDWEDSTKGTIYYEHLQKGDKKMSTKDWKNKELTTLLSEAWGFKFNNLEEFNEFNGNGELQAEDEAFAPSHYCVHHGGVSHNGKTEMAEAVNHNYNEKLGKVTHYDMKLADGTILESVAAEDIEVTNASLAEDHKHAMNRDADDDDDVKEESATADEETLEEEPDNKDEETIEEGEDEDIEERRARGRGTAAATQGRSDDKRAREGKISKKVLEAVVNKAIKEALQKRKG